MSKQIKETAKWRLEEEKGKEKEIVTENMIIKFDKNTKLSEKLVKCKATHFFEATYDTTYGSGFN